MPRPSAHKSGPHAAAGTAAADSAAPDFTTDSQDCLVNGTGSKRGRAISKGQGVKPPVLTEPVLPDLAKLSGLRLTDRAVVRALLQKHGLYADKALGQHFLVNPTVCPRMTAMLTKDTDVLEIGPGLGVLTRELDARAHKVVAVELDRRLGPVLADTLAGDDNVTLVWGDALKIDLAALFQKEFTKPVHVAANLPYYITSPVLMRLLESRLPIETITVLVQKEAAVRLAAPPGTRACGAVSVAVRYYAEPETLFDVSRGSFSPIPKVDSAVLRLTVRHAPRATFEATLFQLVRDAFGQRRKQLGGSLTDGGYDGGRLGAAMAAAGVDPRARAEALTMEQWCKLAQEWDKRG